MKRPHALLTAGAITALAVTLTACGTTPDPAASTPAASATTTPTPSPTPTPLTPEQEAAALKNANIEAAKTRLTDYYATVSAVSASGYQDWQARLAPFIGSPEVSQLMSDSTASEIATGYIFSGATTVSSMTVTGYTEDPSGYSNERVSIDACVDFSGATATDASGTPVQRPEGFQPRVIVQVVMYHLGADRPWAIGEFTGTDWVC
jgi:hypothetical protein